MENESYFIMYIMMVIFEIILGNCFLGGKWGFNSFVMGFCFIVGVRVVNVGWGFF